MKPTLALIAHDRKKEDLISFVKAHVAVFSGYHLIATGTTGTRIQAETGLEIQCFLSGPLGGDVQISAQVVEGHVLGVFFLTDPLYAQAHEPDIQALLRICNLHNVALATNLATAEALIKSLL
ncbi:MAG: methylglyoxal synthase [Synechococcaceae cyanobacterium SM2_3_2]|nr:methylglyoxal synthase [Synechococcaceae cyanobacterium SM2_3_2]